MCIFQSRYASTPRASGEQALINFDLDADLRGVWNWNTKQLFVYVMAEYKTKNAQLNQAVIWDTIVQEEEFALLQMKGAVFSKTPSPLLLTI